MVRRRALQPLGRRVAAEIRFGLSRQVLSRQRASLVSDLLEVLPIEAFDAKVASTYGRLRAELQRLGISLSAMDLLIAAQALALGRTLVSHDQAFAKVLSSTGLMLLTPAVES